MATTPNPEFQPLPGRDAWATIRGFVYQVDVTLLRWLALKDTEELALECGEDIDEIRRGFNKGEQVERLLEQVKYRNQNISLRSPEAVQAVVSFHSQRDLNPGIRLRFRFLCNGSPGQERSPTPFPAAPAIQVWNQVARQESTEPRVAGEGIRAILLSTTCPQAVNAQQWAPFQTFLADSSVDELLAFIGAFEWGLDAPDVEAIQTQVRVSLVQTGLASSRAEAEQKHAVLFIYAIREMARPGKKHLRNSDLAEALMPNRVATIERSVLEQLERTRSELVTRLTAIEQAVKNVRPTIEENLSVSRETLSAVRGNANSMGELRAGMRELLALFTTGVGLQPILSTLGLVGTGPMLAADSPETDAPPLVSMASKREETLTSLAGRVAGKVWCALYGGSGTGKTQLARLIVEPHLPDRCRWFRLRGLNSEQARHRIHALLDSIVHRQPSDSYQDWLVTACSSLGTESMLVLDDLPGSNGDAGFDELLAHLCDACAQAGTRLLSTGHKPLAHSVRNFVAGYLHEESVPLLSDSEIKDIFVLHGAPDQFVQPGFINIVSTQSRGHPVLVVEAVRYLQTEGWKWGTQAFDAILRGNYAADLENATVEDVRRTVPDDLARELLYRLRLINWRFTEGHVQVVAKVPPSIDMPQEKFADLVGLWIQRDSESHYTLSPLITALTGSNLPEEREREVHLAIAKNTVRKKLLGLEEVHQAILHFVFANEHNRAASLLLFALKTIAEAPEPVYDLGIRHFWVDLPLPDAIDLPLRIVIRSMQIVVQRKAGEDPRYLMSDLDALMESRRPNPKFNAAAIAVAGTLGLEFMKEDTETALRYLMEGIRAYRRGTNGRAKQVSRTGYHGLLDMLWMVAVDVRDDIQFEYWFDCVQEFTAEEASAWAQFEQADNVSEVLCNGIWMRMADAPGTQDWSKVMQRLGRLRAWAQSARVPALVAHAARGQIVVQAEYQNDIEGAVALAKQVLGVYAGDPNVNFWVSEITGRQFYFQNRMTEALHWFEESFSFDSGMKATARVNALIFAAAAASRLSTTVSFSYLNRAVALTDADLPRFYLPNIIESLRLY